MNLIPFIILVHGFIGLWGRTATDVFESSAYMINLQFGINH